MESNKWQSVRAPLSKEGLLGIFENRYAYLEVQDFISVSECERLLKGLKKVGFQQFNYNFDHSNAPPAAHVFTQHYLFENLPEDVGVATYFPEADKSISLYKNLVQSSGYDPAEMFFKFIESHWGESVQVAEQNGQKFSYVIGRELSNSALLHADFANFIPNYWVISNVKAQYAWNIYLSDPGDGGELVVYDKPWVSSDDQYIFKNTYGYDNKVVAGANSASLKPKKLSLVLFNSRNFHEVKASTKPRIGVGGHLGLTFDNQIIAWV